MANFTPTNLLSGIAKVTEGYLNAEFRQPDTAAMALMYIGEKTNPDLSSLRTREDRATYYDFPIRKADGGKTARAALHTGNRTDSLRTQVTWKTVVDTFSISMKQLDNNTISFDEAFAKSMRSCINNNLKTADDWVLAQLLADLTQINVNGVRADWNATDYVLELYNTQQDYWKEQIDANLGNNEYNNQIVILADSLSYIDMTRSLNQGSGNAVNLGYQFSSGEIVKTSKSILSGYNGSALAFPMDMVGLFQWIPKQNRKALDMEKAMSTSIGDFGMISIPIIDDKGNTKYTIDAAISIYSARTDTSSYNGNAQDVLYQVELSWDIAYMSAPLSTFRASGDFAGKIDSVVYAYGLTA